MRVVKGRGSMRSESLVNIKGLFEVRLCEGGCTETTTTRETDLTDRPETNGTLSGHQKSRLCSFRRLTVSRVKPETSVRLTSGLGWVVNDPHTRTSSTDWRNLESKK